MTAPHKPGMSLYLDANQGAVFGLAGPSYWSGWREDSKAGLDFALSVTKDFEPSMQILDGEAIHIFPIADALEIPAADQCEKETCP